MKLGVCAYCGKWTTDPPRPCLPLNRLGLEKEYGHDYNHDPAFVAEAEERRLQAHHLWED